MARPANLANTPLSNSRYGEKTANRQPSLRVLTGACNFTNLNIGNNAKCGCQRFCDRSEYSGGLINAEGNLEVVTPGWCMCEHHACFHETGKLEDEVPPIPIRSRQVSQGGDSSLQSTYQELPKAIENVSRQATPANFTDIGLPVREQPPTSIDAQIGLLGDDVAGNERGFIAQDSGLPAIPSQCLLASNTSLSGILGPSLSFKSTRSLQDTRSNTGLIHEWIPHPIQAGSFGESPTDVATPLSRYLDNIEFHDKFLTTESERSSRSQTGLVQKLSSQEVGVIVGPRDSHENTTSQVSRRSCDRTGPEMNKTNTVTTELNQILPYASDIHKHYATKPTLKDTLQNHEDRLDHLENATHSYVASTDPGNNCDCDCDLLSHKHEKIECRMDRVEKILSTKRYQGLGLIGHRNGSVTSENSTIMTSTGHTEMYSRIDSRIEALEFRLNDLDNCLPPSATNPLEFEVIFLPFGIDLNRVWSQAGVSTQRNAWSTQDTSSSHPLTGAKSQRFFTKATTDNSWERLLEKCQPTPTICSPRACGMETIVDKRLRSRGLVKTIEVNGPDAQHVQFAMFEAFEDLLQTMSSRVGSVSKIPKPLRRYREGLGASWIPLRKLHKDSQLRFLETSEMLTPTLWTPSFLAEISMHQGGKRRLYVTDKNGYIQNPANTSSSWTWRKIRDLPLFCETNGSEAGNDNGFRPEDSIHSNQLQIHEQHWNWDERLDGPAAHQTVTTQQLSLAIIPATETEPRQTSPTSTTSSSSPYSPPLRSSRTPGSEAVGQPISPLTERHLSRPYHNRTASMPITVPISFRPSPGSQGKRRIASFERQHERATHSPSPFVPRHLYSFSAKRQRTRSPSRPRDTPRWSAEPPSPYIAEEEREHKRGMTPFAYATPHSNAPYVYNERRSMSNALNDWGVDDEDSPTDEFETDVNNNEDYLSDSDQEHQPEDDDWDGVNDGTADNEIKLEEDDNDNVEARAFSDDDDDDVASDASSSPSEYPSTQPSAMYSRNKGTFEIHVDEEK